MKEEQIRKYCEKYPDYEKYEWYENISGKLICLKGIAALQALMPRYEKALEALENINSILDGLQRCQNPINDYLEIAEALSQIEIISQIYNGH